MIREAVDRYKVTAVVISHDMASVLRIADPIAGSRDAERAQ